MERHTLMFAQKEERSNINVRSWDSDEGDDHLAAMFEGDMSEVLNPIYDGLIRLSRRSATECWVYFTCAKLDQDAEGLQDPQETVVSTLESAFKSVPAGGSGVDGAIPAAAIAIPDDEITPATRTTQMVAVKRAAVMTKLASLVVTHNYKQLLAPSKAKTAADTNKELAKTPDFHTLSLPDGMIAQITHCNSVAQYNAYKTAFITEYNRSVSAKEPVKSIKRWSKWGERELVKRSDAIGHVRPEKLFRMISCWAAMGELRGLAFPVLRSSGGAAADEKESESEGGEEEEQELVERPSKRRKIRGDQ